MAPCDDGSQRFPERLSADSVKKLSRSVKHHGDHFRNIIVTVIFWADGEDVFKEEARRLGCFCEQDLGYTVVEFRISRRDSFRLLSDDFNELLEPITKEDLLIVYYGGHAMRSKFVDGREETHHAIWTMDTGSNSPQVEWSTLQNSLGQSTEAHVLLLLDCCFGASNCRISARYDRTRYFTTLAASDMKGLARKCAGHSFTNAFINIVRDLLLEDRGEGIALSTIYRELCSVFNGLTEMPVLVFHGSPYPIFLQRNTATGLLRLPPETLDQRNAEIQGLFATALDKVILLLYQAGSNRALLLAVTFSFVGVNLVYPGSHAFVIYPLLLLWAWYCEGVSRGVDA